MARKGKQGRTALIVDDKVRSAVIENIKNIGYIKQSCLAAGITTQTFYLWLERAEELEASVSNDNSIVLSDEERIYLDFYDAAKKAQADFIHSNIKIIQRAASHRWEAAAWLLERTFPALFGRRMELELQPSKSMIAFQNLMGKMRQGEVEQAIEGEVKRLT